MCFLFNDRGERRTFWVDGYMVYGNTEFDLNEKPNNLVCSRLLFWKDTWSEPPWTHLSPAANLSTEYWGQFVGVWSYFIHTKRRKITSVKTVDFTKPFQTRAWKQTWRGMEKWVISFTTEPTGGWRLSRVLLLCRVDLVCTHCFVCPGPYFLNISLRTASEMLKFRQLNLGCHLTVARWPSEAIWVMIHVLK